MNGDISESDQHLKIVFQDNWNTYSWTLKLQSLRWESKSVPNALEVIIPCIWNNYANQLVFCNTLTGNTTNRN